MSKKKKRKKKKPSTSEGYIYEEYTDSPEFKRLDREIRTNRGVWLPP